MNYSLKVSSMACGHCKGRIEKALTAWGMAKSFSVDLPSKTVAVESDSTLEDLKAVLSKAGYAPD